MLAQASARCLVDKAPVGKIEKLFPIFWNGLMTLRVVVKAESTRHDWLIERRKRVCSETFHAEQLIHRFGSNDRMELALGVTPLIADSAIHVNRTRRDQPNQHVLVDG